MKNWVSLIYSLFILFQTGYTQIYTLGQNDTLCYGSPFQLIGDTSNIFQLETYTAEETFYLSDDEFSNVIDIGFNFPFYDSIYDQLVIGSNGLVSFETSLAQGYCSWAMNNVLPDTAFSMNNSILLAYSDWYRYQVVTSKYVYKTVGSAPNRKCIVQFLNLKRFGNGYCGLTCASFTLILYENTGEFEIFLHKKPLCMDLTGNYGIQGPIDRSGQFAQITPGRNLYDAWSVHKDGRKWTPINDSTYQIDTIPFVFYAETSVPSEVSWVNTIGETSPYTPILYDTISNYPNVGYYVGYTSSSFCQPISLSDTSWFNSIVESNSLNQTTDFCRNGQGSIFSVQSNTTDSSFFWTNQNIYSDTLTNLFEGAYPYIGTTYSGCNYSDTVFIDASDTLDLVINITHVVYGNDGTVNFTLNGGNPPYTYILDDTLIQNTNFFEFLLEGSHNGKVIDSKGCIIELNFYINSFLNIENISIKESLIFPNPFEESFHIQTNQPILSWTLRDEVGKLTHVGKSNKSGHLQIKPGIYFLTIAFETGETSTLRIIKI